MMNEIQSRKHFEKIITTSDQPIMVLFYTEQSQKSRSALKNLEKMKAENPDAAVYKVNAKSVTDIHPQYNISSVPTVVTFREGKPSEFTYGVQSDKYYQRLLEQYSVSFDDNADSTPTHRVTVYTTPTCPYCTQVKRYLDSNNVRYSEVDVASNQAAAQELVNRTGQQGVPQTEIDGQFVTGYNTQELDRLLNL